MSIHKLNEKWIKATVLGTIWAASEIVLGSFLHNLRIPFSGNILTAIGLIILISASYKWPEKGLFIRAGIICALLKTMSPSAVIFGPMVAILSEAVLLETAIYIFGKTTVGFVIGAILAMSWNLFQKIFNFIVFYGYNIVDVYTYLMKYIENQLGLHFNAVWTPLVFLLILYALFGAISAIIAIQTGKRPNNSYKLHQFESAISTSDFKSSKNGFSYSSIWLLSNFILITTVLVLPGRINFGIWSLLVVLVAITWAIRYKRALKQLSRPRLWIFFVVITMVTALVFSKLQPEKITLKDAFFTGIEMNLRAIVLIMGFTVLGTELYNPALRRFFQKKQLTQLSVALEIALESLPATIANTPPLKTIVKKPSLFVNHIMAFAEYRLKEIQYERTKNIRFFIVTGNINSGKTTFIKNVVEQLFVKNIQVSGFYTLRITKNKQTTGYEIFDIEKGKTIPFLKTSAKTNLPKIGKYYIENDIVFEENKSLQPPSKSVFVLDEIGKLELQNKGWCATLKSVIENSECIILLSLRKEIADELVKNYKLENHFLVEMPSNATENLAQTIARVLRTN